MSTEPHGHEKTVAAQPDSCASPHDGRSCGHGSAPCEDVLGGGADHVRVRRTRVQVKLDEQFHRRLAHLVRRECSREHCCFHVVPGDTGSRGMRRHAFRCRRVNRHLPWAARGRRNRARASPRTRSRVPVRVSAAPSPGAQITPVSTQSKPGVYSESHVSGAPSPGAQSIPDRHTVAPRMRRGQSRNTQHSRAAQHIFVQFRAVSCSAAQHIFVPCSFVQFVCSAAQHIFVQRSARMQQPSKAAPHRTAGRSDAIGHDRAEGDCTVTPCASETQRRSAYCRGDSAAKRRHGATERLRPSERPNRTAWLLPPAQSFAKSRSEAT